LAWNEEHMKAAQGNRKVRPAIGLLMPLTLAMAQVTPQARAPKPAPRRNVDKPRTAPPRETWGACIFQAGQA
jgi:hypothetical protein